MALVQPPTRKKKNKQPEVLPFPEFLQISYWRVAKVRLNIMGCRLKGMGNWVIIPSVLKEFHVFLFKILSCGKMSYSFSGWFVSGCLGGQFFFSWPFRASTSEDNAFEACCRQHKHAAVSSFGFRLCINTIQRIELNKTMITTSCFIRV